MKKLSRILALVLALCTCISLMAGVTLPASAALSTEELQKLVQETALAYYFKGRNVQYGSVYIGAGTRYKGAIVRQTNNGEPEDATPDYTYYTVCSAYPHDVYHSAFDYQVVDFEKLAGTAYAHTAAESGVYGEDLTEQQMEYLLGLCGRGREYHGYIEKHHTVDGEGVAPYFLTPENTQNWDEATYCDFFENKLQPGDIINAVRYADENEDDPEAGHVMMYIGDCFGDGNKYVIHSWGAKYNDANKITANNKETSLAAAWEPGYKSTRKDGSGKYLRGYDIQESVSNWATKFAAYDYGTKKLIREASARNGSIMITPWQGMFGVDPATGKTRSYNFQYYKYTKEGNSNFKNSNFEIGILRPLALLTDADVTPSGRFRLDYPSLESTKTFELTPRQDVLNGQTYTYTIKLENHTDDPYTRTGTKNRNYTDLQVTEALPSGTEFVSATGGGSFADGKICWSNVSLPAGATVDLTFTVRVTGAQGTEIVSPAGIITGGSTAGQVKTRELRNVVGGAHPTANFGSITESSVTAAPGRKGTDVAEDVYAALGMKLELPDAQTLLDSICGPVWFPEESGNYMYNLELLTADRLTDPAAKALRNMVVPEYYGGRRNRTMDENDVITHKGQLLSFSQKDLQPGDVLFYVNLVPDAYSMTVSSRNAKTKYGVSTNSSALPDDVEKRTIANVNDSNYTDYFLSWEAWQRYVELNQIASGYSNYTSRYDEVTEELAYVYLGDGKYAYYDEGGSFRVIDAPTVVYYNNGSTGKGTILADDSGDTPPADSANKYQYSAVQTQAFLYSFFCCLRPSLVSAAEDMTASKSAAVLVTDPQGNTLGYDSLNNAAKAAPAGSTLRLQSDVTLTKMVSPTNGSLTFDLGGHTLNTGDTLLFMGSAGNTLQNGTVTGNGGLIYVKGSMGLTVKNAKLYAGKNNSDYDTDSKFMLYGSAIATASSPGKIILENVEIASARADKLPIQHSSDYTLGSWLELRDNVTIAIPADLYTNWSDDNVIKTAGVQKYLNSQTAGVYRTVANDNTAVYCAKGNGSTANNMIDGYSLVGGIKYRTVTYTAAPACVNETTGTSYASLSDAMAALTTGTSAENRLKLLTDVDLNSLKENGTHAVGPTAKFLLQAKSRNLELDLDGHTIRRTGGEFGTFDIRDGSLSYSATIKNGTIREEGSLSVVFTGAPGTMRFENMTILSSGRGICIMSTANAGSVLTVQDSTIVGGLSIYNKNGSGNTAIQSGKSTIVLAGDTKLLSPADLPLKCAENGKVRVEGATLMSSQRTFVYNGNTNVDDPSGTLEAAKGITVRNALRKNRVDVGGKLLYFMATEYSEPKAVQIGDKSYSTLAEAVAAAKTGETIVPLEELTLSSELTIPEGVTLAMGDKTMNFEGGGVLKIAGTVTAEAIDPERLVLLGGGSYNGITRPAGLSEEKVVHPQETVVLSEQSLTLEDGVVLNTYAVKALVDHGTCTALVKDSEGATQTIGAEARGSYWYFPIARSVAKDMTLTYEVQLMAEDGGKDAFVGPTKTLSIRGYAEAVITETAEDLLSRAMVAMLNYGAEAQKKWNKNTGDLANKNITDLQQSNRQFKTIDLENAAQRSIETNRNNTFYGTSTVLEDKINLRFYLQMTPQKAQTLSCMLDYTDYSGIHWRKVVHPQESPLNPGFCYCQAPLAAADLNTAVTLTVKDGDTVLVKVTDSLNGYIVRAYGESAKENGPILQAMQLYSRSAKEYFTSVAPSFPVIGGNELPIW